MVFVCAWCGPKATLATAGMVTHGICEPCAEMFNAQADALSASASAGNAGQSSDTNRVSEPAAVVGSRPGADGHRK